MRNYEKFKLGNIKLLSGKILKSAQLTYKTYGTLNKNGSIVIVLPTFYTVNKIMPPSSRGLGHFPFTEVTGIRIPLGVFFQLFRILQTKTTVVHTASTIGNNCVFSSYYLYSGYS